jgi:sulfate transport system substrate-binding protein
MVDKNAAAQGAFEVAQAYLQYLYSSVGQQLAAKHYYRPCSPEYVDKAVLEQFPKLTLFTVDEVFGSWAQAQAKHFNDGGTFDFIYAPQ